MNQEKVVLNNANNHYNSTHIGNPSAATTASLKHIDQNEYAQNNDYYYNKNTALSFKNIFDVKLNEENSIAPASGTMPTHYNYENEYYNHYYDNHYEIKKNNNKQQSQQHPTPKPIVKSTDILELNPSYSYWLNNQYQKIEEPIKEKTTNNNKLNKNKKDLSKKSTDTIQSNGNDDNYNNNNKKSVQALPTTTQNCSSNNNIKTVNKPTIKEVTNCYKKFAIGNYAHLLNEPVDKEIDNQKTNEKNQQKKETKRSIKQSNYEKTLKNNNNNIAINENSADFERIASNVNSTANKKWKNSTQQTKTSYFE